MNRKTLVSRIWEKKNYLCIGLDTDIKKIPEHLLSHSDPVFEFNRQIIDATKELCISYKINTAFYEAMGVKGWETIEKTVNYIPETHFKIADAKRGDIGNTSAQYAYAFFEIYKFDAVTVAPYMGEDSLRPFLDYDNKWTIVLGLTSNKGAGDFEMLKTGDDYLYEKVLKTVATWGTPQNLMFVVGATRARQFEYIRSFLPEHFFLVPGVGVQGGSVHDVSTFGLNSECGLLVNVSRDIIYSGKGESFADEARRSAARYALAMSGFI